MANSCLARKANTRQRLHPEQLRAADPEHIIVAPCGFNLERSLREQAVLERHPWWQELQAVRNGNVAFADGNLFFNRSGMTVCPDRRNHRRNSSRSIFRRKN